MPPRSPVSGERGRRFAGSPFTSCGWPPSPAGPRRSLSPQPVVGGALALAGRRHAGAALAVTAAPWLIVAALHAPRAAAQVAAGIFLAAIAATLVSIGYTHQTRTARQLKA